MASRERQVELGDLDELVGGARGGQGASLRHCAGTQMRGRGSKVQERNSWVFRVSESGMYHEMKSWESESRTRRAVTYTLDCGG